MTKTLIAIMALTLTGLTGCAVDYTSIEYNIRSEGSSKASIRADGSQFDKSTAQDASMPGAALEGFLDALKPDVPSIVEKVQEPVAPPLAPVEPVVPVEEIAEPEALDDAPVEPEGQIIEVD